MQARRSTSIRWWVFFFACAISWLLYLHRYAWGVIKPTLKKQFPELTDVQLGWLDSLFNLTYAFGQVPTGILGDLLGPRNLLTVLILLWSGCLAGLTAGTGFWSLAWVRAMFGLAQAGAYPILSQVTRTWFPLSIRTTVQGVVGTLAGRVGGACASFIVATVLMGWYGFSWQVSLLLLSALGVVVAFGFWVVYRNDPADHPWTNETERELLHDGGVSGGTSTITRRPRLSPIGMLTLSALCLHSFTSTFADQLYVFWVPQFLVEGKGLTPEQMGIFAMLPLLGGALGGFLAGGLNDVLIRQTGSRRWGRAGVGFTGKILAAILILASIAVQDGRLVMVVLLACKFFGDWSLPTQWGAITDIAGRASATVFGIVNTMGSVAAFLAGPIMGYVKQEYGWGTLFGMVAGAYLLTALCWLVIDSKTTLWSEE